MKKYLENNKKIDFLLLNSFPQCLYDKYFDSIKEDSLNKKIKINEEQINNKVSYSVNYLLYMMNPRYIITSVDDFYFKNTKDKIINGAGYRTFFYNLSYLEDSKNKNENFYVAFDYKSINDMNDNEILNIDKYNEEKMGVKFTINNNIFKYYDNYNFDSSRSLIENFDIYLKFCFNDNKIKLIKELTPESKLLFLSNFNFNSTEEEIKKYLIDKYGPISMIKLLSNKDNGKFNGKCIVQFNDVNSMKKILNNSNEDKFNGRIIKAVIYIPKDQLNNNNQKVNNANNNSTINIKNIIVNKNKNVENISLSKNNSNSSKDKDDYCFYCENKDEGDKRFILNEFNYFYLSFSKGPINKFHFLIIPKRHISFYNLLSNEEKVEGEIIIKIIKDFLKTKRCDFIIFEKNLKNNFSRNTHLLINVVGFDSSLISKLNDFSENYLLEEKIYNYNVIYNDLDLYFYQCEKYDKYIYINIPIIFKEKTIRKVFIIEIKEYKIDYPRKMICLFLNEKDRINWRNTINTGELFIDEIKKDIKIVLDDFFSK